MERFLEKIFDLLCQWICVPAPACHSFLDFLPENVIFLVCQVVIHSVISGVRFSERFNSCVEDKKYLGKRKKVARFRVSTLAQDHLRRHHACVAPILLLSVLDVLCEPKVNEDQVPRNCVHNQLR